MIHEIVTVGPLECNCSIIGDPTSHEAVVIDPGADVERIVSIAQKHGLSIKLIAVTHAHIDHVGGAMRLKKLTGAPILMNQEDTAQLKMLEFQASWVGVPVPEPVIIDSHLSDGDRLKVGNLEASIIHTPGHTEGSVCLYMPAEKKLISGDTLFAGSIGRTDLPGGSLEKILDSLNQRILKLPDETIVVPGHGPITTIGREREFNPFLE